MNNWLKIFSLVLGAGGILVVVVGIAVDWIGLSTPGLSSKQLLVILTGVVLLLVAVVLGKGKPHRLSLYLNRYSVYVVLGLLILSLCFGYSLGSLQLISRTQEQLTQHELLDSLPQISPTATVIDIQLRNYHIAADPDEYDTELDSYFTTCQRQIPVQQTALILVDIWESGTNDGHTSRTKEIVPLIYEVLQVARENHMLIIHATAQEEEVELVKPLDDEVVVDYFNCIPDDEELDMILRHYNIRILFYVGFATNMCILDKPYGMKAMYYLGYEVILVRDATTGVEFHDTLDGMWATEMAIRYVEYALGYSCLAHDFIHGI